MVEAVTALRGMFACAHVSVFAAHGTQLELIHEQGDPLHAVSTHTIDEVKRTGRPLVVKEAEDLPAPASEVYAPIRDDEHVIGILSLDVCPPQYLSPADADLLMMVADKLGLGATNARLRATAAVELAERMRADDAARDRAYSLEELNRILVEASVDLDLEQLFDSLPREAAQLLKANSAALSLVMADKATLEILGLYQIPETMPRDFRFRSRMACRGRYSVRGGRSRCRITAIETMPWRISPAHCEPSSWLRCSIYKVSRLAPSPWPTATQVDAFPRTMYGF